MEEYDIDPEVLAGFIDETVENLQAAEQMFIHLEANPDDIETVNSIFRPIHSLKGTSGFFGLIKTKELAHSMENLLDAVRKGEKKATKEIINALLPGIDQLNLIFENVRSGKEEIADSSELEKYEKIHNHVEQILSTRQIPTRVAETYQEEIEQQDATPAETLKERDKEPKERRSADRRAGEDRRKEERRTSQHHEVEKTMRVSERSIDSFLEYVGELVVVEEMFNYLQKKLASLSLDQNISKNFKRVIETFSTLSESLRNSILEIRSVPAQSLLQKAPRIIRTLADDAGKLVDVIIEGDNIRIDKSYVELLDAPLTHMIRNAVDHGIEPPSERAAAGKPEKGTIKISIQDNRENIDLVVSEDGRGLNLSAIYEKAVKMGLVAHGQRLEENRIIDMLFMSGVSTAEQVTDISGRGVGMDVVKRNIDSAGGVISVETKQGQGTTFKITLPKSVSTQIVDGFLVKSGNETYVLPMEIIGESFVPEKKDVSTVSGGKGEMVLRRGVLMSVVHLSTILGMDNIEYKRSDESNQNNVNGKFNRINALDKVMITVEMDEKNYALCVDDILGVQKVVVKHVEALPVDTDCFEGAAMMGDGTVAMIISVDGLKKIALE